VPSLSTSDPYTQDLSFRNHSLMSVDPNGILHALGTDQLGRDALSRMALAGRISLTIAVSAVTTSMMVGTALGLVAGYFGGGADSVISTVIDIQLSVPQLIVVIAVVATLGSSLPVLTLTLGLTLWPIYARVIRVNTISLREREFVEAARAIGATPARVILVHLLPSQVAPILVLGSFELGQVIILEAGLSYLGLGVQAPLPAWGSMLASAQDYLHTAPLLTILPGLAIFLVVACVNIISQRFTGEERGVRSVNLT
jgi:peptide/nickel transport system permease protein